jgi:hypothetical protein
MWSLLKVNTCFVIGQGFQKQPNWVRGCTLYRTHVCARRERNWKIKQHSGAGGREISVFFVVDTHCEIIIIIIKLIISVKDLANCPQLS